MTISQIRNQIHRLQRKFARELAVYRLRQVAEDVADAWKLAIADREELPQPLQIVRRIADTGQRSHNYMDLHRYVQRCRDSTWNVSPPSKSSCPCSPGPTTTATTTSSTRTCSRRRGARPCAYLAALPRATAWVDCGVAVAPEQSSAWGGSKPVQRCPSRNKPGDPHPGRPQIVRFMRLARPAWLRIPFPRPKVVSFNHSVDCSLRWAGCSRVMGERGGTFRAGISRDLTGLRIVPAGWQN